MDNLTRMTSPSEMLTSLENILPTSNPGARSGSSNSEQASLFEAALSLVQALADQMSGAGGANAAPPSAPPGAGAGGEKPAEAVATGGQTPTAAGQPPASGSGSNNASSDISAVSAGSGPNSTMITNTSNHDEKIGQFVNGGSTTQPAAEIELKPGQSGTLNYQNGQGGFDEEADSAGNYQSSASRLEFNADQNGKNNDDVSYIDGRNASISVSDGQGHTIGDTKSIAADAPGGMVSRDPAGNATIQGWYDGSTNAMQAGGAYLQSELGTGNAYIHPDDDQNKAPGTNPMTMAGDVSQHYTASFGNT